MSLKKSFIQIAFSTKALAIGTMVFLVACGDDITEITQVNEFGMKVIESGEKLPKCTTENEGALVYALDSAAAYACVNREWTSFNGKDGADGKDGKDGKDGEDGEKGDKGDQGKKGDKGDKGDPGETGEQGPKGDKGDDGDAGTSCTMEALADSSGYKVICGGDSVAVILNGKKGDKGDKGDQGDQGPIGKTPTVETEKITGGTKITFGVDGGTKSIVVKDGEGCSLSDRGDGTIIIWCGSGTPPATESIYKAMCGDKFYDPNYKFCDTRTNDLYTYVKIGAQTWMGENLNNGEYSGCTSTNQSDDCKYSKLFLLSDGKEMCPGGWHLPSLEEFKTLINAVGGENVAGKKLKATNGWLTEDGVSGNGTDSYGFSAFPTGWLYASRGGGGYHGANSLLRLWTTTRNKDEPDEYYILEFSADSDAVVFRSFVPSSTTSNMRNAVRCLKD